MKCCRTFRRCAVPLSVVLVISGCQSDTPWDFDTAGLEPELGPSRLQDDADPPADLQARPAERAEPIEHLADPDQPLVLSLEQAVFTSLANNRELEIEQLNPVAAGTFEQLERAVFDPAVFIEPSLTRSERMQPDPATQTLFPVSQSAESVEAGIRQQLHTGTSYELALRHERSDSDRTPAQHQTRVGLTLTQALLRGASQRANLASIHQARIDRRISEYELRGFTEALVAEVEATYWDYALARRRVEIFEASVDVALQQQRQTEQRVEVGVLPRTELAAARAEVAARRQELLDARNFLEQLRLQLLHLINPAAADGWDRPIKVVDEPRVVELALESINDHTTLARRFRPEINEAQLRLERGRLDVIQTRSGLLPRLDLFATLGKSGFAQSFNRAYRDLDGPAYDLTAGLTFEQALGNRGPRAEHEQASVSRRQAALSLQNLAQLIELDIRTAFLELERTREQIDATAATRELRAETLRAEQEKFDVGRSTAFLVAQAQRDYFASQIDEIEAIVAYRQAIIDFYRLEGTLLQRRGISAPGAGSIVRP